MASSSLTVSTLSEGVIRKFGGVRSEVRSLYNSYLNMTYEEFLNYHPRSTEEDFQKVNLTLQFNKS